MTYRREILEKGETVWVHAHEYLNDCGNGGGGFDWYYTEADARDAFNRAVSAESGRNWGHFLFPVRLARTLSRDEITAEIDSRLADLCATATAENRRIGQDLAATWARLGYDMGPRGGLVPCIGRDEWAEYDSGDSDWLWCEVCGEARAVVATDSASLCADCAARESEQ